MGVVTMEAESSVRRHGGRYIYEELRKQILTLQLKPGAQLDEVSLAAQFGVSRSPVRDALARLISEGLVTILPNRTTLVTPFEIEEFPHYIAALDLTQRAVTRLAAVNRTEQELERIREANVAYVEALGSGNFQDMSELNKAFHLEIARAGHNPYLTRYYEKLLGEGQRLLHLHFDFIVSSQSLTRPEQDHDEIVQAIANRQADAAEEASHVHTLLFRDRFLEFMKQNMTKSVSIL
ncbi:GntR family transcriptional regulator [Pseudomonas sp. PIC25]|uniref:GntR family transcriptional regulator n=1 Tax=Pseudomonas sp. PIC25 TaxID=1958773 RepID=UPI000BDA7D56|nr:GntR family transcriptional regulator [Pseudomonas sp. PIC25]PAU63934.1 GntR family transcriptional regulator [Pseudomonas sp. PIC25]